MKSGFLGWLTLLFIYLKLTGQVEWGWWAVWSPMILGFLYGWLVLWSKEQKLKRED